MTEFVTLSDYMTSPFLNSSGCLVNLFYFIYLMYTYCLS